MPEELTLLPCPACGASDVVLRVDTRAYGFCTACGMCGPCAPKVDVEYVVKQWNALPRALEWTTEPQLGAWNWWRDENSRIPRYVYQDGTVDIAMQIDRVPYQKLGGQWAGPIPEPRPHEQEKNNV